METNLKFKPYIADNFYSNQNFPKVLVFGESHYGKNHVGDEKFTNEVIEEFLDGANCPSYKIYTNIGLLFNENDKYEFWKNGAYSNLIQGFLSDCDDQPLDFHKETVIPAFWLIINEVKPDKIIICSSRAWNYWMPDTDIRCRKIGEISEKDKGSAIWEYEFEGGGKCTAIGINHPSSIGFSHNQWRPLVQKFIFEK